MYEYDDDEDLPGAERGSGLVVGARGAKYAVDAEYETSNRSPENPDHEQLVRPAARLCTYLSFLIPSFQLSLPTVNTVQTKLAPCVHFSLGQHRPVATGKVRDPEVTICVFGEILPH